MLILDKQKAIERVVALAAGLVDANPEARPARPHARTYHRVATYERRPQAEAVTLRRAERRRRRIRLAETLFPSSPAMGEGASG